MLAKINKTLRAFILVIGAIALIFKLTGKDSEGEPSNEGFQTEEFDDIW